VADLTRFHEAIDQALAESLVRFEADVERAKETFLAILGHDLRTPLGAIQTSAAFLLEADVAPDDQRTLAVRIRASAERSLHMVGELLDFTRSRLGGGIPVVRAEGDLLALVRDVVAEVSAAHPVDVSCCTDCASCTPRRASRARRTPAATTRCHGPPCRRASTRRGWRRR
jgi:signal transduction histidine kinase